MSSIHRTQPSAEFGTQTMATPEAKLYFEIAVQNQLNELNDEELENLSPEKTQEILDTAMADLKFVDTAFHMKRLFVALNKQITKTPNGNLRKNSLWYNHLLDLVDAATKNRFSINSQTK